MKFDFSRFDIIALDFDGTIIKSNHIKDKAFNQILLSWPEHKDKMMKFHLENNSLDRNEKFNFFVTKVLKLPPDHHLIDNLSNKFSKLTKSLIIQSSFVDGANEFLHYFYKKTPLYLLSATPKEELKEILDKMDLTKFFKKVYGAPIIKRHVLKSIVKSEKITKERMLYIGDSPEDKLAAKEENISFISIKSDRTIIKKNDLVFNNMLSFINN